MLRKVFFSSLLYTANLCLIVYTSNGCCPCNNNKCNGSYIVYYCLVHKFDNYSDLWVSENVTENVTVVSDTKDSETSRLGSTAGGVSAATMSLIIGVIITVVAIYLIRQRRTKIRMQRLQRDIFVM